MCRRVSLAVMLLVPILSQFPVMQAHAIPAFTRQHKTECTTCHTIYPELNEYGQAFLKNAYVYSAKPAVKGPGARGTGEQAGGAAATSEGIRLSGIPDWLPLSVTATQSITYNDDALNDHDWDFGSRSLVLQAGGSFRERAGFYATYDLYSHATVDNDGDDSRLDELFLVGRRLFGTPINVKFGRFEPRLSLWKKSDRVIASSFATAAYTVGGSPFSLEASRDALEVNAVVAGRMFMAAGIVDVDGQRAKDGYGHFSVKFGGADFLGHEPEMDLDKESLWDFLSLTLAGYGYAGSNAEASGSSIRNHFYRAGGEADVIYKRLRLRFSGVTGRDTNADFSPVKAEEKSLVLATELQYQFGSPINIIGLFRYEHQDDGSGITRRYIPAVAYAPLQNIRLALQYNHEDRSFETGNLALLTVAYSF